MVLFRGMRLSRPFVGICLTEKNIEKLKKDQPIFRFKEEAGNILSADLVIIYAETEDDFMRRLQELELISRSAKVTDERSKKDS